MYFHIIFLVKHPGLLLDALKEEGRREHPSGDASSQAERIYVQGGSLTVRSRRARCQGNILLLD